MGFASSKGGVLSIGAMCGWCGMAAFVMVGWLRDGMSVVLLSLVLSGGGIITGFVVYHTWCFDISIAAIVQPLAFSNLINLVPFLLPTWLNV